MAITKHDRRKRIKYRIRRKVTGTAEVPRLSVYRSNKHIYAQVINDKEEKTLLSASSLEKDIMEKKDIPKKEIAALVGKKLAEKAKDAGLSKVTFDRGGYLYHGRVKTLADNAREGGLNF